MQIEIHKSQASYLRASKVSAIVGAGTAFVRVVFIADEIFVYFLSTEKVKLLHLMRNYEFKADYSSKIYPKQISGPRHIEPMIPTSIKYPPTT